MPQLASGPLAGMYAPEYAGGSTVNLLASLIKGRGGTSPHAELEGVPASQVKEPHAVVYLVLDGLGLSQLRRHLAKGLGQRFFSAHPHQAITTVFPATTAAAVTTFDTGASPAEHGILSWFLHLPDLGCIGTILRTTTRVGTPLVPPDFDLRAYYQVPSYVETVEDHIALLSWGEIPNVPFGRVGTRWADRRSYQDLPGLAQTVAAFAREDGRRLAYAYWPRYDGVCHELGCEHEEVDAHFELIDQTMADLVEALQGTDTLLCVLADHGLVTVERDRCIDLATVPGLMDCLAVAPAGDQRQMSCFVRPRKEKEFLRIAQEELGDACMCLRGEDLLSAAVFGPGTPHPSLENRLGDYVLLCREGYAIIYTPTGTDPLYMPGSHGGMSAAEIQIPLYAVHVR